MATKAGYAISRDEQGLTGRERQVLEAMATGAQFIEIADKIGVSKQRVTAVVGSLIRKGYVLRTNGGGFAVRTDESTFKQVPR